MSKNSNRAREVLKERGQQVHSLTLKDAVPDATQPPTGLAAWVAVNPLR